MNLADTISLLPLIITAAASLLVLLLDGYLLVTALP